MTLKAIDIEPINRRDEAISVLEDAVKLLKDTQGIKGVFVMVWHNDTRDNGFDLYDKSSGMNTLELIGGLHLKISTIIDRTTD